MLEIVSVVICILTHNKLKDTENIQSKKLEIINTVGFITLLLVGIFCIFGMDDLAPLFLFTTPILSIFYITNIKKLHSINKVAETVVYCPKCGISLKGNSSFCYNCGEKIS